MLVTRGPMTKLPFPGHGPNQAALPWLAEGAAVARDTPHAGYGDRMCRTIRTITVPAAGPLIKQITHSLTVRALLPMA